VVLAIRFLYHYIAQPLGEGVIRLIGFIMASDVSGALSNTWLLGLIGFPLAIIIVFFAGYLTASFLGRAILRLIENWVLRRFPVVRSIYPYAKQFSDLFLSSDKKGQVFQRVVAVQYPRAGIYVIGFVTSGGMKDIDTASGKKSISLFIPSSPTPFTGYTIFVPEEDTIPLAISVDEAIRLLVSGGVLIPPPQGTKSNSGQAGRQARINGD
jgi:uncharacterized membrane protein